MSANNCEFDASVFFPPVSKKYKVWIKSNMAYAKYYHLTDARGRYFMLRVANVLPPCICSLIDPPDNQWKVPENLLEINLSDIWDPKTGWESHKEMIDNCQDAGTLHDVEVEGQHGDGGKEQNGEYLSVNCCFLTSAHGFKTTMVDLSISLCSHS